MDHVTLKTEVMVSKIQQKKKDNNSQYYYFTVFFIK